MTPYPPPYSRNILMPLLLGPKDLKSYSLEDDLARWRESPEYKAHVIKRKRVEHLTNWMNHIPYVGSLVHTFWYCMLYEGPVSTCKPRWGALTFSFLNDGQGATVWHTWRSITHDNTDPYTGIYINGAPNSLKQAQEWDGKWKAERLVDPPLNYEVEKGSR